MCKYVHAGWLEPGQGTGGIGWFSYTHARTRSFFSRLEGTVRNETRLHCSVQNEEEQIWLAQRKEEIKVAKRKWVTGWFKKGGGGRRGFRVLERRGEEIGERTGAGVDPGSPLRNLPATPSRPASRGGSQSGWVEGEDGPRGLDAHARG